MWRDELEAAIGDVRAAARTAFDAEVDVAATTKRCGACKVEKPRESYSKKQWAAKAVRRCAACIAHGVAARPSGGAAPVGGRAAPNGEQRDPSGQRAAPNGEQRDPFGQRAAPNGEQRAEPPSGNSATSEPHSDGDPASWLGGKVVIRDLVTASELNGVGGHVVACENGRCCVRLARAVPRGNRRFRRVDAIRPQARWEAETSSRSGPRTSNARARASKSGCQQIPRSPPA